MICRLGVKYVGGEPLLRSDVGQIYTEAKNRVLHDDEHDSLSKKKRGVGGLSRWMVRMLSLDQSRGEI